MIFFKVSLSEEEGEPTFIVTMDGIDEQYFKYKQKQVYTQYMRNHVMYIFGGHVQCSTAVYH